MKTSLRVLLALAIGVFATEGFAAKYSIGWQFPSPITTGMTSGWAADGNQFYFITSDWFGEKVFNSGLTFANNNWNSTSDKRGGFGQFANDSVNNSNDRNFFGTFGSNITFDNFALSGSGLARGGVFYAFQRYSQTRLTFGDDLAFSNNSIASNDNTAQGGAIWWHVFREWERADQVNMQGLLTLGNNAQFINNSATSGGFTGTTLAVSTGTDTATADAYITSAYQAVAGGAIFALAGQRSTDANYGAMFKGTIGENAVFSDNFAKVTSGANAAAGGAIATFTGGWIANDSIVDNMLWTYGNNVSFTNNYAETSSTNVYGGAIYNSMANWNGSTNAGQTLKSNHTFLGTSSFVGNHAITNSGAEASGGAIASFLNVNFSATDRRSVIEQLVTFTGNAVFKDNYSESQSGGIAVGGAIRHSINWNGSALVAGATSPQLGLKFEDGATFENNFALGNTNASGGAIALTNPSSPSSVKLFANFRGDVLFSGNYAQSSMLAPNGGAIFNSSATLNFNLAYGEALIFEDNYTKQGTNPKKWNSVHFIGNATQNAVMNISLMRGAEFINKDPFTSPNYAATRDYAQVNIIGEGYVELWGDNRGYSGAVNITADEFVFKFDEADPYGRAIADISSAKVVLGPNLLYRPMVNETQLARLSIDGSNLTVGSNVLFRPIGISALTVGNHVYNNNDNYGMVGFDSDFSTVSFTQAPSVTTITIKRGLTGYNGWNDLADAYRLSSLNAAEREELDQIYMTGSISQAFLDMAEFLGWNQSGGSGGSTGGGGSGGGGGGSGNTEVIDMDNYGALRQMNNRLFTRTIAMRNAEQRMYVHPEKNIWINGSYGNISKSKTTQLSGWDYKPLSLTIGIDADSKDRNSNIGLAVGYGEGTVNTRANYISKTRMSGISAALYGSHEMKYMYLSGNTGVSFWNNRTENKVGTLDTNAKFSSNDIFANAEIGAELSRAMILQPYTGVGYLRLYNSSIDERGTGGARHIDSMTWNVVEIPLGFRIGRPFAAGDYIMKPTLDLTYARNVGQVKATGEAYFISNPNMGWIAESYLGSRNAYRAMVSFDLTHMYIRSGLTVGYGIEKRGDLTGQQVQITYRFKF